MPYKYQKIGVYIYFLVLIYITFFSAERQSTAAYRDIINLDLFSKKQFYFDNFYTLGFAKQRFIVVEIIGNLLLFTPFCYTIYVLKKKRLNNLLLIGLLLLTVLSVESLQYLFNIGVFDIDDIVLNFTGGVLGLLAFNFLYKKYILR